MSVGRTTRSRQPWRVLLVALAGTIVAIEVVTVAPSFSSALGRLQQADARWVAVSVAAAALSMSFFARTRRRLLAAAGVQVTRRDTLAAVYVANALHVTLPGGAAFSTAWTYRWMRSRGASGPAITWTLIAGGVLSTSALAVLALTGSVWAGHATGSAGRVSDGVAAALLMAAVTLARRRPQLVQSAAIRVAGLVDRARGRARGHSESAVRRLLLDGTAVRPRPEDWGAAAAAALANWALDSGCLWASAAALGVRLPVPLLLLSYTAGMAAAGLSLVPGGLGLVDGAMVAVLTAGGLPVSTALPAVLLYRLISLVGVVCVGWLVAAVRSVRTTETHSRAPGVAGAWEPQDDVPPPGCPQLQDRSGSGRLPHRAGRSLLRSM